MSKRRKKRGRLPPEDRPVGVVVFKDERYPDVVCVKIGFKEKVKDGEWASIQQDLQQRFRANFPLLLRTRIDGEKYKEKYAEYWAFVGIKNPDRALRTGHVTG